MPKKMPPSLRSHGPIARQMLARIDAQFMQRIRRLESENQQLRRTILVQEGLADVLQDVITRVEDVLRP